MQQPPLLHAFAPQQICPEPPHGVPFGVVDALDPHEARPKVIATAAAAQSQLRVESAIERLQLEDRALWPIGGARRERPSKFLAALTDENFDVAHTARVILTEQRRLAAERALRQTG
jgi:hypothetical protein